MNNKIRTTESIPVIDGTTLAGSQHTLKADVVIVGSGAGGAVNAYELAAKGLKVIVLEAGDFFPSSQFRVKCALFLSANNSKPTKKGHHHHTN